MSMTTEERTALCCLRMGIPLNNYIADAIRAAVLADREESAMLIERETGSVMLADMIRERPATSA